MFDGKFMRADYNLSMTIHKGVKMTIKDDESFMCTTLPKNITLTWRSLTKEKDNGR